ncbi:MAG TPA: ComF family protein [Paracoccaceae bacterium]|nr:ComF family protein [Paracoccaceae bacterium]
MRRIALPLAPALASLREALFPPLCPGCGEETGVAGLCPTCWRETRFLDAHGCRYCSRPIIRAGAEDEALCDDCLRWPPLWQRGRAVFHYESVGRRLVLALKHGDRLDLVPMLGAWMLRAGRDLLHEADLIAPVPLHWTRRVKRRTNQAAELARFLAPRAGARHEPRLLLRGRRTSVQDGKNRAARAENVAGAFTSGPGARAIRGKRVILIDDVLTTGATLSECARLCLASGARAVDVLVLALVVREEFPYLSQKAEQECADGEQD